MYLLPSEKEPSWRDRGDRHFGCRTQAHNHQLVPLQNYLKPSKYWSWSVPMLLSFAYICYTICRCLLHLIYIFIPQILKLGNKASLVCVVNGGEWIILYLYSWQAANSQQCMMSSSSIIWLGCYYSSCWFLNKYEHPVNYRLCSIFCIL